MQFRTQIPIPKSTPDRLLFEDYIFGCFCGKYMSEKLDYFKFQNSCNPFGILFHPLAIEINCLAVAQKKYLRKLIFFFMSWH
jgi:hypothetical protein